jgi:hypothetical protein
VPEALDYRTARSEQEQRRHDLKVYAMLAGALLAFIIAVVIGSWRVQ